MRIIIDGNDGVGKTTLAKRLQQDLNIKSYIHLSYNDPTNYLFYATVAKKTDVIFDRSFIDEPIYEEVLKRPANLNDNEISKLYDILKELDYIVIICYADNKNNKEDEYKEIKDNEKYIDRYFEKVAKDNNYIYFNAFEDDYYKLLEWVERLNAQLQSTSD